MTEEAKRSGAQASGSAGQGARASQAASRVSVTISADRVSKGKLLMAGLAEEIRGVWETQTHVDAYPADDGHLYLDPDSMRDLLNWLRRALTTIRTLDLEIFEASDRTSYLAARNADSQGMTVRGLTGPRNNAVHHPEVIDPAIDRAMGPFDDNSYFIVPDWVERTPSLTAMFTSHGRFSNAYARAYDDHVARRSLLDPLMDAFAFFDHLAPDLARRGADGNLAFFPLTPPPYANAHYYFRLSPDSPNETKQRAMLDVQLKFQLALELPLGRERVITGAFRTDAGDLVLTGLTAIDNAPSHLFLDKADQVQNDIRGGFRYLLATAHATQLADGGPLVVGNDLTLAHGSPLPISDLEAACAAELEVWRGRWELCEHDSRIYLEFRRPR